MSAWARSHLGDKIGHVEQYAAQTGEDLDLVLEKFGYEKPEIPQGFEFVWEWFFEIAGARTHNGYGWNALSFAEIEAWAKSCGVRLEPWIVRCFRAMDHEWRKAAAEEAKKENGRKDGANRR